MVCMKTLTIIIIILGILILGLFSFAIYSDKQDKEKQNVYEYLSNGKYSTPLTEEQSKLEGEREFWRAEEINARNKQGAIEVQLLNLNEKKK